MANKKTKNNTVSKITKDIKLLSDNLSRLTELLKEEREFNKMILSKQNSNFVLDIELTSLERERDKIKTRIANITDEKQKKVKQKQKEKIEEDLSKETYNRSAAAASFQSGNMGGLISGLIFSYLGRNEKTFDDIQKQREQYNEQEIALEKDSLESKLKSLNDKKTALKQDLLVDKLQTPQPKTPTPVEQTDDKKTALKQDLLVDKLQTPQEKEDKEVVKIKQRSQDDKLKSLAKTKISFPIPISVSLIKIEKDALSSLKTLFEEIQYSSGNTSPGPVPPITPGGGRTSPGTPSGPPGGSRIPPILPGAGRMLSRMIPRIATKLPWLAAAYGGYKVLEGGTDSGVKETLPSFKTTPEKEIKPLDRAKSSLSNVLSTAYGLAEDAMPLMLPLKLLPDTYKPTKENIGGLLEKPIFDFDWFSGTPKPQEPATTPATATPNKSTSSAPEEASKHIFDSFNLPIGEIEERMIDKTLVEEIRKQFPDEAEAEAVMRLSYSESGGNPKSNRGGADMGAFQFNVGTAPSIKKKLGINPDKSVVDLSAKEQVQMYKEYIEPLVKSGVPLTAENLKVFGFASSTGKTALIKEMKNSGDRSSVIYPKADVQTTLRGHSHFQKMAELSDAGGDLTLKGMRRWMGQGDNSATKANTQPVSTAAKVTTPESKIEGNNTKSKIVTKEEFASGTVKEFNARDYQSEIDDMIPELKEQYPLLYPSELRRKAAEQIQKKILLRQIEPKGTRVERAESMTAPASVTQPTAPAVTPILQPKTIGLATYAKSMTNRELLEQNKQSTANSVVSSIVTNNNVIGGGTTKEVASTIPRTRNSWDYGISV
jgi:hypothetical protein